MRLTLLMLFCFSLQLSAQDYYQGPGRLERHDMAWSHANALGEGVVFVRLQTKARKIEGYRNAGMDWKADEIAKEQARKNKAIMEAFHRSYTFSKYYFFYSKDAAAVKAGNYQGVIFDAESKRVDFERAPDQAVYYISTHLAYSRNSGADHIGFTLLDEEFEPLDTPFPYYIMKHQGTRLFEKSYEDMVMEWQEKWADFRRKSNSRHEMRAFKAERKAARQTQ